MFYYVRELVSTITDDPEPVAVFTSFFDASDYVGEHPEMNLFIEMVDEFLPVITKEDIDAYMACDSKPTSEGNPLDGFDEWDLPRVLMFLGWVAEFKALEAQSNPDHFGYERMLYSYSETAEAIANL